MTYTGGYSRRDCHPAPGPARPHSLPTGPGVAPVPTAGLDRFNNQPMLCGPNTHMEVTRTKYHRLPSKVTGHRPLQVQLKVLQVAPTPSDNMDQDAQPLIRPPEEYDTPKWMAYYRTCSGPHPRPPERPRPEPRHETSGSGVRPPRGGLSRTGDYDPTLGPTLHGRCHMV